MFNTGVGAAGAAPATVVGGNDSMDSRSWPAANRHNPNRATAGRRTTAARTMSGDDALPRRFTFWRQATPAVLGIPPEVSEGGHGAIAAGVAEPARGPHRRRAGVVRVGDGELAGGQDRLARGLTELGRRVA